MWSIREEEDILPYGRSTRIQKAWNSIRISNNSQTNSSINKGALRIHQKYHPKKRFLFGWYFLAWILLTKSDAR